MQLVLTDTQEESLRKLLGVFLEENTKINLSALRTEEKCWTGNILDALAFLSYAQHHGLQTSNCQLIDVGTGGGFPLLPIAIVLADMKCTGLDTTGKKLAAIGRIAETLHLPAIQLIHQRTEVLGHDPAHREHYDFVTARAVAALPKLLEWTVPFAKIGGKIVLWKSLHIAEELAASAAIQKELHCHLQETFLYDLGGEWGERQLLIFEKTAATPDFYPIPLGTKK